MKNVTISLPEETARWIRVKAAENDISVSKYLGGIIEEMIAEERNYRESMNKALSFKPENLSRGKGYPSRDELHER